MKHTLFQTVHAYTHHSNVNGLYAIQHEYKHDIYCIIESTSIPVRQSHYGTLTQSFWVMWSAVETPNIATYSCVPGHKSMMYDGEENEP